MVGPLHASRPRGLGGFYEMFTVAELYRGAVVSGDYYPDRVYKKMAAMPFPSIQLAPPWQPKVLQSHNDEEEAPVKTVRVRWQDAAHLPWVLRLRLK